MKFNNVKILFFLLATSSLFITCKDLEEDFSSVFLFNEIKTDGDIKAALAPIYRLTKDIYKNPHATRIMTFGSDDITTWNAGNKAPFRVFDKFEYGDGQNSDLRADWYAVLWNDGYRIIYFSNNLINELKKIEQNPASIIADAEARFFRAYFYFNLVRSFGNLPIILDDTDLSVKPTRATVLENYMHIEADLIAAAAGLPLPSEAGVGRVSSSTAKAVLADLYLTWGGWPVKDNSKYELAAKVSKEVIDLGYHQLLNINELWKKESQNSSEALFSVQYSETENLLNVWPTAFTTHKGRGFSDVFAEIKFFEDFPAGPRKDATFRTDIPQRGVSSDTGKMIDKNPATIPWENSQRKHPLYEKFLKSEVYDFNRPRSYRAIEIIRYAEVLLIYAEAQTRVGQNAAAIEALNQVKRRAAGLAFQSIAPGVDVSSASIDEIIAEKGWELAGEGKRWFDLVRTEKVAEVAMNRSDKEQNKITNIPTSKHFIVPIPLTSLLLGDYVQNPEGFKIK